LDATWRNEKSREEAKECPFRLDILTHISFFLPLSSRAPWADRGRLQEVGLLVRGHTAATTAAAAAVTTATTTAPKTPTP